MTSPKKPRAAALSAFLGASVVVPVLVSLTVSFLVGRHLSVPLAVALAFALIILRRPRRWLVPDSVALVSIGLVVVTTFAVYAVVPRSCFARATYSFEDGTPSKWDIRDEGGNHLGDSVTPVDTTHCGCPWEHWSLAFTFTLGGAPFDKAQLKIDNRPLSERLDTYIYVPRGTSPSLRIAGYVLEHKVGDLSGPEYPFYKTRFSPLRPGKWTRIQYKATDFVGVNTNGRWANPPLLIGFELSDSLGGRYQGTTYFDKIDVA